MNLPVINRIRSSDIRDYIIFAIPTVIMAVIVSFGVAEIVASARQGFASLGHSEASANRHSFFVTGVLNGLECFLLAPLPVLLILTIRDWICNSLERNNGKKEDARNDLLRMKSVIVGLMATVLATSLLEKAFSNHLTYEALGPSSLLMLMLVSYTFLLDRHRSGTHEIPK